MSRRDNFLSKPISSYYLLLGSTAALTGLGLVMILSASSIHSLETNGSSYAIFLRQCVFLLIAIPCGFAASRLPIARWKTLGKVSLLIAIVMLLALRVPGVGHSINGNTNWLGYGPFVFQPSEFAKFLLVLWAGHMMASRERSSRGETNVLLLLVPGFAIVMLLIMAGRDLGNAAVFASILLGLLFISGIRLKIIALGAVIITGLVSALIYTTPNRMRRVLVVFNPFSDEYYKLSGWQPAHSIMGLASGGLFGVGLGASRQKWGNLAEAHTDFIFSVIGEELGLLGTLCVLLLLATLIFSIFRIAIRANDPMIRYASAGVGCWIATQTVLNIGSATSTLPVVGVTLPLLSYGGSSVIATYLGLGFVLGAALRDPAIAPMIKRVKK
ncbi:MAG: putative lipid II flippase FtsW [Streptomycetaceae bacterium]|nr:MAG: putative lipid II flippase FtsW [Streptomycetaceae bacterium]